MKSSDAKQLPAVRLRALEPEDLDFLYRIENDEALWDCGTTNVPYSRQVLREYILSARNDIYADGQVRLMAENEAGEVVGIGDFVNFDPRHQRAEIGLVVPVEYRRRGYGSAIVGRLITRPAISSTSTRSMSAWAWKTRPPSPCSRRWLRHHRPPHRLALRRIRVSGARCGCSASFSFPHSFFSALALSFGRRMVSLMIFLPKAKSGEKCHQIYISQPLGDEE